MIKAQYVSAFSVGGKSLADFSFFTEHNLSFYFFNALSSLLFCFDFFSLSFIEI